MPLRPQQRRYPVPRPLDAASVSAGGNRNQMEEDHAQQSI
jgi:hypothetical protein